MLVCSVGPCTSMRTVIPSPVEVKGVLMASVRIDLMQPAWKTLTIADAHAFEAI